MSSLTQETNQSLELATNRHPTRLPPRKSGSLVEWGALREPSYVLFALGVFFFYTGLFILLSSM